MLSFLKKNPLLAILIFLFIVSIIQDGGGGSRKSWWKKFKKGFKHFTKTAGKALSNTPIGQGFKYGKMLFTNPKKLGRTLKQDVIDIGNDFKSAGKGIGSAGKDIYHGRFGDAYHDFTHGMDPLVNRVGDSVTGGAFSALEDATGRDSLDYVGRASDWMKGGAHIASDIAHGDFKGAYDDYVNTASPYIQFGGDVATGGMASTISENTGWRAGDYIGNWDRTMNHPGQVAQGLVDSGIQYGIDEGSDALMGMAGRTGGGGLEGKDEL
jgi:hypothetical protein